MEESEGAEHDLHMLVRCPQEHELALVVDVGKRGEVFARKQSRVVLPGLHILAFIRRAIGVHVGGYVEAVFGGRVSVKRYYPDGTVGNAPSN